MFDIVLQLFETYDKEEKFEFFEKYFLLINININIVLKKLFLNLSNLKINFLELKLP